MAGIRRPFAGFKERWIRATKRPESDLAPVDIEWFGLRNLTRAAKLYNTFKFGRRERFRRRAYRDDFAQLIAENGPLHGTVVEMRDSWAIDATRSLPHLDRLLAESEQFIAWRGGKPREKGQRAFIKDILCPGDLERFPSFLDFATSSEVLSTVSNYMGMVPVLSNTVPPGVRFVESTAAGQLDDGIYRQSQLYHLDFHDSRLVYVIVLLRDVTVRNGPFTFLGADASARAARGLNYGARGVSYRMSDDAIYRHIDRAKEEVVFTYPRGTVLFMDSSRCFHFGSRDAIEPRYQMMYAYVSPCRADFAAVYLPPARFPVREGDSRLRQMVLQETFGD